MKKNKKKKRKKKRLLQQEHHKFYLYQNSQKHFNKTLLNRIKH